MFDRSIDRSTCERICLFWASAFFFCDGSAHSNEEGTPTPQKSFLKATTLSIEIIIIIIKIEIEKKCHRGRSDESVFLPRTDAGDVRLPVQRAQTEGRANEHGFETTGVTANRQADHPPDVCYFQFELQSSLEKTEAKGLGARGRDVEDQLDSRRERNEIEEEKEKGKRGGGRRKQRGEE